MKERFGRLALFCPTPFTPADEAVRTVVKDEAGDERRLSGRGTVMG
jgi:hypothetical protein